MNKDLSGAQMVQKKEQGQVGLLFSQVVQGGFCIGCGACSAVKESPIKMRIDEYGMFQPTLEPSDLLSKAEVLDVCPFSNESQNEDLLGRDLFGEHCQPHPKIGFYLNTYAGYVREPGFRDQGSSGGLGSWVLTELLRKNKVDAIIHIHEQKTTGSGGLLFRFGISKTVEEVRAGAKSRYYPVEMSEVLKVVREQPLRFAVVGVPCFIKAVRLLSKKEPLLAERIKYCIGLVCGHLKSAAFAEMIAWENGISLADLRAIDFRKKIPTRPADHYGVALQGLKNGEPVSVVKESRSLPSSDWGKGFFKYSACDYCDDVLAETADLAIGDAWLPEYVKDGRGTNIVITRAPELDELLKEGMLNGKLELKPLAPDAVAQSQNAGLRHRREGLAYRLFLKDKNKQWRPVKRVQASAGHLSRLKKKIFRLRIELASASHLAFKEAKRTGDPQYFYRAMAPLVKNYDALYAQTRFRRLASALKRVAKKILRRQP